MPNESQSTVSAITLRFQLPADGEIEAAESIVALHAARVEWRRSHACERTYGLVEHAGAACASALRAGTRATVFDPAVIALAVFPSMAEALPPLLDALGGPGRPAGVAGCQAQGLGAIVEWDLDRTSLDVLLGLIDLELERFRAQRATELLTPLPLSWWTRIAAVGLRAPEISAERVLETQLEVHGVAD
jgi:hypothetical protein